MDLSAFDNITVDNKGRISPADRAFCDKQQELFNKTFIQIRENQKELEKQLADNPNPAFEIRYKNPRVSDEYTSSFRNATDENCYRSHEYSPLYALKACEKLYKDLCEYFERKIIYHFNDTYDCSFKVGGRIYKALFPKFVQTDSYGETVIEIPNEQFALPSDKDPIPSYETIVDYIIAELGGKSFQEKQCELDLQNFMDEFSWSKIEVSKNVVKIIHCIYYDSWRNRIEWESRKKIGVICKAVRTIFSLSFVPRFSDSDIFAGEDIDVYYGGGVLDSFKAFKNGNLQLTFHTAEQAKLFADTVNNLKPQKQ